MAQDYKCIITTTHCTRTLMIPLSPGASFLLHTVPGLAVPPIAVYSTYQLILLASPELLPPDLSSTHGIFVFLFVSVLI